MNKIRQYFIKNYTELPFHTKLRSNALLALIFTGLLLIVIQAFTITIFVGSEYYLKHSLVMSIALSVILISGLFALRKLSFEKAGSFVVTAFLVTHISLLFTRDYAPGEYILQFSGNLYISLGAVSLSVLFSTRKMLIVNSFIFLTATALLYYLGLKNADDQTREILTTSLSLIAASAIIITIILYYTMSFAKKAQKEALDFTEKVKQKEKNNRKLLETVSKVIDSRQDFTTEVNQAVNGLSSSTSTQAADLEEISATLEEIDGTAEQNASQAERISRFINETSQTASESGEALKKSSNSIEKITDHISLIEEIAFQTKLLSLNASIQAAKAGEHGKGFSAVADEIQKLSQRSNQASVQIHEQIRENTKTGTELENKIQSIITNISEAAKGVENIAQAAQQQRNGTAQVSQSTAQVNKAAQSNAGLAEQISKLQEKLTADTRELRELLDKEQKKGESTSG